MTETADERRRRLGIPIHTEADHDWRTDNYCNCGARKPGAANPWARRNARAHATRGKTGLDIIERNAGANGDRG